MSAEPAFVPLRPIPLKDRAGIVFLQYGELDVLDSAFVLAGSLVSCLSLAHVFRTRLSLWLPASGAYLSGSAKPACASMPADSLLGDAGHRS